MATLPEDVVAGALSLLAIVGVLGLLSRLARSVGRAMLVAAEVSLASGVAEVSARRGDLTRMREGREAERRARTSRRHAVAAATLWLLWLALPLALNALPIAYALAAPLWLFPDVRWRGGRGEGET